MHFLQKLLYFLNLDEQELSDMDAIQLVLDVPLKRTTQNSQRFFFKQQELTEAAYPLLISYLAWLRKINATPNQIDVMQQNEEKKREFKFLCKRNLLFFLTVTGQFNVIEKLFKTPTFATKLRHLRALIKKERHKIRQKKRRRLLLRATAALKAKIHNLGHQKHDIHGVFNIGLDRNDINRMNRLSAAQHNIRKIKTLSAYISTLACLGTILKSIQINPNLQPNVKKVLPHQVMTVPQCVLKNKNTILFTAPLNQQDHTPGVFGLLFHTWQQLYDDILDMGLILNPCQYLAREFEKIGDEEITASKKLGDELEKLSQDFDELQDEFYLEKKHSDSAENADNNLSSLIAENSINIKNSPFMSRRLTFFSPKNQYEHSMQLRPTFNFNEQKTENNLRAGN